MIATTRRRGRRSLAAILAAMLMASVLAVVAGSPAQAANTSGEALVDTNDDGVPDAREFGGRDRYDTALRLAKNFGAVKGLGNVPTAFVASGYTLVDSVSVSGLAGFLDAPVLLTPTDSLHGGVADFIEDYGVDTIYVLGGSAAVADSVLEDLEALANEPTVTRIEGADRYATAAAIAAKLGGGAAWCGGEDAAAILVNGGDVSLAEAMMVGPIAHRLQLPVLLTAADELPSATTDFIEAEDIEHVVIVGGTDSVSEDVADAVSDAGVDTVERIAGDTAAATSVALAGLLAGACKDDLAPASDNTVALVHRDALPDGVAAAPVLSSTYADGYLVPILVVGDTLPASVRDYLAATPAANDDGKLNLSIVAIGGTAAVSSSVMDAAVAAAASADALTVSISSVEDHDDDATTDDALKVGERLIKLNFSDNIGDTDLADKIRDILEVNGAPAQLGVLGNDGTTTVKSVVFTVDADDAARCEPDSVTVALKNPLNPGDTISVVAGASLGASGDKRAVGATSVTVAAEAPDRTRPTISIIMIAGRSEAEVTVSMGDPQLPADAEVTLRNATAGDEKDVEVGADGSLDFTLNGAPANLVAGDRVTIASGAIEDGSGNKSLQRSFTVIAAHKSPRITSVLMSNPKHTAQAAVNVPPAFTGADALITIVAKTDGAAAGAAGNGWSFVFDVASSYSDEKALDIDVRVNSRDQTVFVRFNNGKAKFSDLQAALEGNSAFSSMFDVKLPDSTVAGAGCDATANNPLTVSSASRQLDAPRAQTDGADRLGVTTVAIEVRFNGYVATFHTDELLHDVLAATLLRNDVAVNDTASPPQPRPAADRLADLIAAPTTITPAVDADITGEPKVTARYVLSTQNAKHLPQVRDLVTTAAGIDRRDDDQGTDNVDESRVDVAPVATGYAGADPDDDNTANVKERENAASQVRIGRSSGVDQPE